MLILYILSFAILNRSGLAYNYPCNFTILVVLPVDTDSSASIIRLLANQTANTSSLPCDLNIKVAHETFQKSCATMVDGVAALVAEAYYQQIGSDYPLAAIVGSGCEQADGELFGLARELNILVLAGSGLTPTLASAEKFPTVVGFSHTHERAGQFVYETMNLYNWTKIAVIYDAESDKWISAHSLTQFLRQHLKQDDQLFVYAHHPQESYTVPLDKISTKCRIILLLLDPTEIREVMLLAAERKYTSGDYVFIALSYSTTNMYFESAETNFTTNQIINQEEEKTLIQAFRRLFLIRLKPHSDAVFAGLDHFRNIEMINDSLIIEEENTYLTAFDKALQTYDHVLYDLNTTTWESEIFDGISMAERFQNRTFRLATRNLTFGGSNKLLGRFELLNFVIADREFKKVLEFYDKDQIPRKVDEIVWPDRQWPPLNEPVCGYEGTNSICIFYENRTVFIAVLATVLSVIFSVLAVFVIYKLVKRQRAVANATWWQISSEELSKSERGAAATHAMFRFETVHLVPYVQTILTKKTERELRKLRMTKHDKLVRFYGLCTTADLHVIVMEYCSRGNLHYLSRHSDPFLCDWNFKFSVMKDVAEGLLFIHTSWMKCHGRLRSDKCMLNSRFTAKIADYALHDLIPEESPSPENKLWMAPEILRLRGQEPTVEQKRYGDLYSLSIIMTEVSMMCDPFIYTNASMTPSQILDSLEKGRQPPFRPKLRLTGLGQQSIILKEIIENCWKEDPMQRTTIKNLLVSLRTLAGEQGTHMLQDLLDRMTKHAEDMEKKTIQMTKDLVQQRINYKEIITNILPRTVALKVIAQEKVNPETFNAVTILVASLANIPTIISKCQLDQFVDVLNSWIRVLTYGSAHFSLTRVRSINDTWMVVGGFPQKMGFRHVAYSAQYALYLQETVSQLEVPNMLDEKPKALIGFHTGPAMTCLVGNRMPFYVILGDTPIISRILQYTCEPGKIHISQHTATLLEETRQFYCEQRQKTALHEKAVFRTCWLTGMTKHQPF